MNNKTKQIIAQLFSALMHPLLMPIYLTLVLMFAPEIAPSYPIKVKIVYIGIVTFCCSLLPLSALLLLEHIGTITSFDLHQRNERFLPMSIIMLCYFICIWLLQHYRAPGLLIMMIQGIALAIMLIAIISLIWKISAHTTSAGGALGICILIAIIYHIDLATWTILITLLGGTLGWARLHLNRHTVKQVNYGYLTGFSVVILTYGWHLYF